MTTFRYYVIMLALAGVSPARAQFIVDHQPYSAGGPGADTLFPVSQLPFTWQQLADDFAVAASASVTHVNWWGFHTENLAPESESMRIRLYAARQSDGLPGDALYEETFINPERIDTGNTISIGGLPHEYRYHVRLATPLNLMPDVGYWLEIAQVGDPDSGFRWEFSRTDITGFAFMNNLVPEWNDQTPTSDLAFQLVVPEPMTASLLLLGFVVVSRRRPSRQANPQLAAES